MQLIDRYLNAISPHLPRAQREDILAELGDNLRSQMEDREAQMHRSLTDAEQEAILNAMGSPIIVAGRYSPNVGSFTFGRQWIGPELFPYYLRGVKYAVGIATAIVVAISIAMSVAGIKPIFEFGPTLLFQAVLQFTIQTCVWVGIQTYASKRPGSWNASVRPSRSHPNRVSRMESAVQLVVQLALLPWLVYYLSAPGMSQGGARLAPVWHEYFLPIVAIAVAMVGQAAVNLVRPDWIQFRWIARASYSIAGVVVTCLILRSGEWIVIDRLSTGLTETKLHDVDRFVNGVVVTSVLICVAVGQAIQATVDLYRLIRHGGPNGVRSLGRES